MIVFKCDGERWAGEKCKNECEAHTVDEKPFRWISINGSIKNELPDARLIEGHGLKHFCSRECLEYFLFKNEKAHLHRQANVILRESEKTINWMLKNMKVDNQSLQSDSFNIPVNTLQSIKNHFEEYKTT